MVIYINFSLLTNDKKYAFVIYNLYIRVHKKKRKKIPMPNAFQMTRSCTLRYVTMRWFRPSKIRMNRVDKKELLVLEILMKIVQWIVSKWELQRRLIRWLSWLVLKWLHLKVINNFVTEQCCFHLEQIWNQVIKIKKKSFAFSFDSFFF